MVVAASRNAERLTTSVAAAARGGSAGVTGWRKWLAAVLLLMFCTAPAATHAQARAERASGVVFSTQGTVAGAERPLSARADTTDPTQRQPDVHGGRSAPEIGRAHV